MPILVYFAFVTPTLIGLLFFVSAMMGPPGPMPLTTNATALPTVHVTARDTRQETPVLTVREGIVPQIPKGADNTTTYAQASTGSAPTAVPAKPDVKQAKTKVAKASSKKRAPQQQVAQFGWQQNQQNQSWGGGGGGWDQQRNSWDQQERRSSRNASNRYNNGWGGGGGRYAMSGQQNFFSPFGMIR